MNEYSARVLNEFLESQPPHLAMVRAAEAVFYKKYLPFKGKILDVGCGDGFFAWSVYERQLIDVGIDVKGSLWLEAQERGNYKKVIEYDGYHIPARDEEFDTVVSNCVLEHVPEVEKLIKDMSRVTKSGGKVLVTVVTDKFGDNLMGTRLIGPSYKKWFNRKSVHNSPFAAEKWLELFKENGLEIIETGEYINTKEMTELHDVSHYMGIPHLVTRKLTGKWVWGPSKWMAQLWEKVYLKTLSGPQTKVISPYLFIAVQKSKLGDGRRQ